MENSVGKRAADNIRILSLSMVEKAKSGHPGGAMGGADFIHILFSEYLRFDPDDAHWFFRDRFFLDPGHMSPMLYSQLALLGNFTTEELENFRQWGSPTHGHPELNVARGIENTSGPLGLGHAMALGAAVAERFYRERFGQWTAHKTYVFISDGGIQEEVAHGVGRIAGTLGLSNYIMFYDSNDIQLSHTTDVTTTEDVAKRYEAYGWTVHTIDGNDHNAIRQALDAAQKESNKPTLIIGKTVMGKGALTDGGDSFERQVSTHGQPLSKAGASVDATIKSLGGNPETPFVIFDDVASAYEDVKKQKREVAGAAKKEQTQWESENSEKAAELKKLQSNEVPDIDYSKIQSKPGVATRASSGDVLSVFAKEIKNMIVSSADLCNSDNTQKFLDGTKALHRDDFSGQFLQAGVSELTMSAIISGLALHGGVFPVCATFFVFSDYMKPAIRIAALMGLPVKYVWTHDSFRVGEDGPTHEPIEQEAQIRLLEKMANLDGEQSMLVLRPADSAETVVAWKMAMENQKTPTALILTRQNVPDLPTKGTGTRYEEALEAQKGGYALNSCENPDITLVGNGSDVSLLLDSSKQLSEKHGINARVISVISEGLFRQQPAEYQESLIPFGKPVFGVTAGLPDALSGLVGPLGKVFGMEKFGASAPAGVLEEKFGYTTDAVTGEVLTYLEEYKETVTRLKNL